MKANNPLNAYRQTSVKTAGQGQLIVMLYDGAVRSLDAAIELLESDTKELDKVHNAIVKAQDIVTELAASLDMERGGEIAQNLFSLYMFFNSQLVEGNIQKKSSNIKTVRDMLSELRSAWGQIANQAPAPSPAASGVNLAG